MSLWQRIARRAPDVVGSPRTFALAVLTLAAWLAIGPAFHFSGNWLLIPATATSVIAVVLVLLLQFTQNRDTRAIQLKLDELIRSLGRARTELVRLEELSDEELAQIEQEFERLRRGE